MPPPRVSSYTRTAVRPVVGSLWVWKPDSAPEFVRVTRVHWNGEEWWVVTEALDVLPLPLYVPPKKLAWNDLTVFWENCHYIAPHPGVPARTTAIHAVRRGAPRPDEMEPAAT